MCEWYWIFNYLVIGNSIFIWKLKLVQYPIHTWANNTSYTSLFIKVLCFVYRIKISQTLVPFEDLSNFGALWRSLKLRCPLKISQSLWRCDQGSTYRWFYCMYEWRNTQHGREAKMKFTTNSVIDKINNDHAVMRWISLQMKEKTLDGEGGENSDCTWHKSCMSQGTEKI